MKIFHVLASLAAAVGIVSKGAEPGGAAGIRGDAAGTVMPAPAVSARTNSVFPGGGGAAFQRPASTFSRPSGTFSRPEPTFSRPAPQRSAASLAEPLIPPGRGFFLWSDGVVVNPAAAVAAPAVPERSETDSVTPEPVPRPVVVDLPPGATVRKPVSSVPVK